jgi:hypothetical protein
MAIAPRDSLQRCLLDTIYNRPDTGMGVVDLSKFPVETKKDVINRMYYFTGMSMPDGFNIKADITADYFKNSNLVKGDTIIGTIYENLTTKLAVPVYLVITNHVNGIPVWTDVLASPPPITA